MNADPQVLQLDVHQNYQAKLKAKTITVRLGRWVFMFVLAGGIAKTCAFHEGKILDRNGKCPIAH